MGLKSTSTTLSIEGVLVTKGPTMKELTFPLLLLLSACSKEPNVAVRIDCGDYNDKGLQATLNRQPAGDCPVDIMVHAGEVYVSARKDNEDASYLFAEAKMTLAENAMKRIKLDIQPVYTEEYYYRRATDITGMQAYLEKQPDGKRRNEVSDKLEQHYFDKATDISGMQAYLEKQPGGRRKAEVETRLKTERAKLDNFAPGLVMVHIPAGSFMMGCSEGDSDCSDYEKPRHQVNITAFALSKTEVTFAQYDVFAKATKRLLPGDEGWGRGNRPVINVSWDDAVAYSKWLSVQTGQQYRLPSEAEWEFAARAGSTSKYSWGNSIECGQASFDGGEGTNCYYKTKNGNYRGTAPVASFAANPLGLHDMHGNVWEFTQDCWYDNYENAPSNGAARQRGDCEQSVLRSGAWFLDGSRLRASDRTNSMSLDGRNSNHGFRLALTIK